MNTSTKQILVLDLIDKMWARNSWCGETHLQKSMYFLEDLAGAPMELGFILYKHGPYSFDFHDMIGDLRMQGLIEYEYIPPYGPRIKLSPEGKALLEESEQAIADWSGRVETVAECLADKRVVELEKLGTALLVFNERKDASRNDRAKKLHELKPHIDEEDAKRATEEFDEKILSCFLQ